MDHFQNPRNVGEIENASGTGTVGNAKCGDIMRIYLDIDENQVIRDVKFKTFGCGAAVATSSMATEMVKGLSLIHIDVYKRQVFVVEIRKETNEVVIGDEKDVFSDSLTCSDLNWMAVDGLGGGTMEVTAKIRYSHRGAPCVIRDLGDGRVECRFREPQRAVTPGQAVVFYDGEYVVGGGVIQ